MNTAAPAQNRDALEGPWAITSQHHRRLGILGMVENYLPERNPEGLEQAVCAWQCGAVFDPMTPWYFSARPGPD